MSINRLAFATLALVLSSLGLAQTVQLEIRASAQITDFPPPVESSNDRWTHGYMAMFTKTASGTPPEVWMYDRRGNPVIPRRPVWFPGVYHVAIHSVAPTPDGTVLISSEVWQTGGARSVAIIAEMISDGSMRWFSRGGTISDQLCVTSKGIIFALGGPLLGRFDKTAGFELISRYSRTGRLEATSLPFRASPQSRYEDIRRDSRLVTSADGTVGFYNGGAGEWTEFDSSGQSMGTLTIPLPVSVVDKSAYKVFNIVMTSSGSVYAWLYASSGAIEDRGIFRLDRVKRRWVKLDRSLPPLYAGIYGVDGEDLITRFSTSTYAWFRINDTDE